MQAGCRVLGEWHGLCMMRRELTNCRGRRLFWAQGKEETAGCQVRRRLRSGRVFENFGFLSVTKRSAVATCRGRVLGFRV